MERDVAISREEKKDIKKSQEEFAAEEKLRAEERAADAKAGDPGAPGPPPPGWQPGQTAGQAEIAKQAQHTASAPNQFSPVQLRADQAEQGITNYVQPDGPGRLIGMTKSGMVPERTTREGGFQGPQFSPYIGALHGKAAEAEQGANAELAWMRAGENAGAQQIEVRRQEQERRFAEGQAQREDFKQRMVGLHRQKIEAMGKDIENSKVDPKRLFKNMGAGQVALLGIGGILASLGAGFSAASGHTGPSPFIEQLRMNVQNDIRAQEHEIAKKEGQQSKAINALDALQQTFGDRETAILALEALQLKAYDREIAQLHGKYENTALGPRLKLAQAQVAKNFADTMMKMEAQGQFTQSEKQSQVFAPAKPIYAGGGPGKRPKLDEALSKGMDGIRDYLHQTKAAGKEAIIRRFTDALPERQRSTFMNYVRDGNLGQAMNLFNESAFDGDAGRQTAFMDATDLMLRERTGAVAPEEEKEDYKKMLGQKADGKRLLTVVGHMQRDLDGIWNQVRNSQPDFAATWEIRNDYYRNVPQRALGNFPVSATKK